MCFSQRKFETIQLEVEMFHRLLDFIGMASSEYLLIIDTPKRLKHTMPLTEEPITGKILFKQLQPFLNFIMVTNRAFLSLITLLRLFPKTHTKKINISDQ